MATEDTNIPAEQADQEVKQTAWYDCLIDIFKWLLGTSNFSYGTKKKTLKA